LEVHDLEHEEQIINKIKGFNQLKKNSRTQQVIGSATKTVPIDIILNI